MRRGYAVEIALWTLMPTESVTMKMTVTAVLTNVAFAMALVRFTIAAARK